MTTDDLAATLRFDDRGLIPAVVQQHDSGEVLMVAWMDRVALRRTIEVGEAVFYSRSRRELWHKGATSGNTQRVVDLRVDCDGDTLLLLVDQLGDGVACHTGERSCFHRRLDGGPAARTAAGPPMANGASPAVGVERPGLDDPGPDDAGLDDAGLDDAGLDDAGLDDPGLDDPGLDDPVPDDPAPDQERAR